MLTCEELLLLMMNDDGKAERWGTYVPLGMTAALIADLVTIGRIEITEEKYPRVNLIDNTPTGDGVLDSALTRLADKNGRQLQTALIDTKLDPTTAVARRLADAGIIDFEPSKMFGLVGARYPTIDPRPEAQLRERLDAVMRGSEPSQRDAMLLAILDGLDAANAVFASLVNELGRREFKRRLNEVSADIVEGQAVSEVQRHIALAVVATTAGGSAS